MVQDGADDLYLAEQEWVAREAADLLVELGSPVLVPELRGEEAAVRDAVRRRLARVDLMRFLSEFARRSHLGEEDPARAIRELPALRCLLDESLEACGEVLEMLRDERRGIRKR